MVVRELSLIPGTDEGVLLEVSLRPATAEPPAELAGHRRVHQIHLAGGAVYLEASQAMPVFRHLPLPYSAL